jgi:tRNA threonylcarbamoyladenosine biosynthesis protein TsaB
VVVISIDTSQRLGGVALAHAGRLLGSERFGAESSHLVELGRAIERLLAAHDLSVSNVDRLALVSGPGSFTGLRIGMAFVKGLHAGLRADVVTIGSLVLLALPHLEEHERVCAMIDAHKSEVYAAVFGRRTGETAPAARAEVVVPPCAMAPRRFLDLLPGRPSAFVGSGVARYHDVVEPFAAGAVVKPDESPSPAHLALIAHRLEPLDEARLRSLEPTYIRSSEAELKRLRPIDPT